MTNSVFPWYFAPSQPAALRALILSELPAPSLLRAMLSSYIPLQQPWWCQNQNKQNRNQQQNNNKNRIWFLAGSPVLGKYVFILSAIGPPHCALGWQRRPLSALCLAPTNTEAAELLFRWSPEVMVWKLKLEMQRARGLSKKWQSGE